MTVRQYWLGSVGPLLYDDVADPGIQTEGQMLVATDPTLPTHVLRKKDALLRGDIVLNDVTGTRTFNTTYTNTHAANALLVFVFARCAITVAGGSSYMQGKQDTNTPPTTPVTGQIGPHVGQLNEDLGVEMIFYVAPGINQTYRVDTTLINGTIGLDKWFELVV